MTRAGFILLFLLTLPVARDAHGEVGGTDRFDAGLATHVYAAALGFMQPRILEPATAARLTLWGLKGLTTLDPAVTVDARDQRLRLRHGRAELLNRAQPGPEDIGAWSRLAAESAGLALPRSAALREAGTTGIIQAFFDELFNQIDPYARYSPPQTAATERAQREGKAGIGLTLTRRNKQVQVRAVIAGGPAHLAGIATGDTILMVDGQSTSGPDLSSINAWLAGPEDTEVQVSWRDRAGRTRHANLARALVPPETVFAERQGSLLTLRISDFNNATGPHLQHEIEHAMAADPARPEMAETALRGIILDLRGNRGGVLRQALHVADVLLPAGTIGSTTGRDPDANRQLRATGGDLAAFVPVVIVVDGRTASAAEVLAAALADRGRAVVIGSTTLGKGLVQTIAALPDGGELRVSWSRLLAPLGWPIQTLGVLPQICTSLGTTALASAMEELRAGRAPMAAALARHRAARPGLPPAEALAIRSACPAAEGPQSDITLARQLIDTPGAYATALLPPMRLPPIVTPAAIPATPIPAATR